jgi:Fic family protein
MARSTGTYETPSVAGEKVQAFVPYLLPPVKPKLAVTGDLLTQLQTAETNLARPESAGRMVPSLNWFVNAFVRKEAVISSQIEGTQASLTDLFTARADAPTEAPPEHIEGICNYLEALTYARGQLRRKSGLSLWLWLRKCVWLRSCL